MELEAETQCPHCWQTITILVDTSVAHQQIIEDCEVCCNPITFEIWVEDDEISSITADPAQ